ncbi:hypothetical protein F4560_005549 [Saccharothrix ecbatanensis]|uniref:Guanylate cyclase domain-containing protein n=1 Tax=Saccharothrix ecbatanensis TaxID=1105145 RepID=A0A7W9M394_9PSEU|nr:hypothetical protein [Saccharothrix ecbatanensis]MBB5805781.1 hypothetical protein [Saccharothrix ecbatanensis]
MMTNANCPDVTGLPEVTGPAEVIGPAEVSPPPRHRVIFGVDVEASTCRTNPERAVLRQIMYALLEQALDEAGVTDRFRDPIRDRGDGALVIVRPVDEVPKTVFLSDVAPRLSALLDRHAIGHPGKPIRLRAVLHAGEVHYDRWSSFGEALDLACRLLDADEARRELRQVREPLVLVVSEDIHRSLVRHGYPGIDATAYRRLVDVRLGEERHAGWVHVPRRSARPAPDDIPLPRPAPSRLVVVDPAVPLRPVVVDPAVPLRPVR